MKIFETTSDGVYEQLEGDSFPTEKDMQNAIEANLGVFFHGLEFLDSEVSLGSNYVDTVAFDHDRHCFVIIEYKNVKSESVLNQCMAYSQNMKSHKEALVLLLNKCSNGDKHYVPGDFDWSDAYVIVIAPDFTRHQIEGRDSLPNVELHKIRSYKRGFIALEQLSGTPHGDTDDNPSLTEEWHLSGTDPEMCRFYYEIKDILLGKNLKFKITMTHIGFYTQNGYLVCGIYEKNQDLFVYYGTNESNGVLSESDFVIKGGGRQGNAWYCSYIQSRADIERMLPHIEKIRAYRTNT